MSILMSLAPLALFAIGVAVVYYRFRDNFSDLAAATDSKQSGSAFWTIVALIYAVVIAVLYLVFYHGHIRWQSH